MNTVINLGFHKMLGIRPAEAYHDQNCWVGFIAGGCVTTMAGRIPHRPYLGESAVNRTFIYATSCRVKWDIRKTGVSGHVPG